MAEKVKLPAFQEAREQRVSELNEMFKRVAEAKEVPVEEVKKPDAGPMNIVEAKNAEFEEYSKNAKSEVSGRIEEFKKRSDALFEGLREGIEKANGPISAEEARGNAAMRELLCSQEITRDAFMARWEADFDRMKEERLERVDRFKENWLEETNRMTELQMTRFNSLLNEAEARLREAPPEKIGEEAAAIKQKYGEMEASFIEAQGKIIDAMGEGFKELEQTHKMMHSCAIDGFNTTSETMIKRHEKQWKSLDSELKSGVSKEAREWKEKGIDLFGEGKSEEALTAFQKAVEINPEYVDARVRTGVVLSSLGRQGEALAEFDKALEFEPENLDAMCRKGNVLLAGQKFNDARAVFDAAIELDPENYGARVGRARTVSGETLEAEFDALGWDGEKRAAIREKYDDMVSTLMDSLKGTWFFPVDGISDEEFFHHVRGELAGSESGKAAEGKLFLFLSGIAYSNFHTSYESERLLAVALDAGDWKFNCYSSSALFGDVCARAGVDIKILLPPGHVLLAGNHYAFETTVKEMEYSITKKEGDLLKERYRTWIEEDWGKITSVAYDWGMHTLSERAYDEQDPVKKSELKNAAMASEEKAIALVPREAGYLVNKSSLLKDAGRHDEALSVVNEALSHDPEYTSALNMKGRLLVALEKPIEALDAFYTAVAMEPEKDRSSNERGYIIQDKMLLNESLDLINRKIQENPDLMVLHEDKQKLLLSAGRDSEVPGVVEDLIKILDRKLSESPNSTELLDQKKDLLLSLGRTEEAIGVIDMLVKDPENSRFYLEEKADLLIGIGKNDEAAVVYDAELAKNPADGNIGVRKAKLLQRIGRNDEAIATLDSLIGMGKLSDAMMTKGDILKAMGKHEEAADAFMKVKGPPTYMADAWFKAGEVLRASGQKEEALKAYDTSIAHRRVMSFEPMDSNAQNVLVQKATLLNEMGRKEEALASIQSALNDYHVFNLDGVKLRDTILEDLGRSS